jgi:hypothetical protein
MTNEEHVDIRITRTGNRKTSGILEKILETQEDRSFPSREDHDCMYEEDSERAFQYSLKRNPILERLEQEEAQDQAQEPREETVYSQTLKPMLRDATGALEQRGRLRIRRYDRGEEVVWVVQIDRRRARFLDRIFSDFVAFLRRTFNAE